VNDDRFYTASAYFDTRSDRHGYGLTYSWGNLGGDRYSALSPSFWLKPTPQTFLSYSYERTESFGISAQNVLSASWDITPEQALSVRWVRFSSDPYSGQSYRAAYRRQVRKGMDAFAVYNRDSINPDRVTLKLVWALGGR
jgi:hypothetical protein